MQRFEVEVTASFERRLRKNARKHPDVIDIYEALLEVLTTDPHNHSGSHPITKLVGRDAYRYRKKRWRFVYSIHDDVVRLALGELRGKSPYRGGQGRR